MQQVNHETVTEETPKDQESPKEKEPEIERVYTEEEVGLFSRTILPIIPANQVIYRYKFSIKI